MKAAAAAAPALLPPEHSRSFPLIPAPFQPLAGPAATQKGGPERFQQVPQGLLLQPKPPSSSPAPFPAPAAPVLVPAAPGTPGPALGAGAGGSAAS
ncbi:proline-rich protein 13-like, partial [Parus major]|uniref:proline-rich protein 13-like n=1 Tax=Parus major TaxID=9157 RepID=UPI001443D467